MNKTLIYPSDKITILHNEDHTKKALAIEREGGHVTELRAYKNDDEGLQRDFANLKIALDEAKAKNGTVRFNLT